MNQKEQWEAFSNEISTELIVKSYQNPQQFQTELAHLINSKIKDIDNPVIAEIGCEIGTTLMLTQPNANKIFFDYDQGILLKVEKACNLLEIKSNFICEDMFDINKISPKECHVVFNSGVIEHYDQNDRIKALKSYLKILKPGGWIIVAYPNHYSVLYRFAYTARRLMGKRFWPWPSEFAIKQLRTEMSAAGLTYMETILLDDGTVFKLYPKYKIFQILLKCIEFIIGKQYYIRVCVAQNNNL